MKSILKLALLLVVGILTYNYFLGTEEEKATTQRVLDQVKEVGRTVGEVVKTERQKFADGKYDDAFDKLEKLYGDAKEKLGQGKEDAQETLERFEQRREELMDEKEKIEQELSKDSVTNETVEESKTLEKELKELMEDSKAFLEKVLKEE